MKLDIQAAQQAKAEKIKWAKENLDLDWGEDETHWKELAKKYSFRLPSYYQPNTETRYCKRLMKHLGADMQEYLEYCGCKTLAELVRLNPRENAVAFCGYILEWWEEKNVSSVS